MDVHVQDLVNTLAMQAVEICGLRNERDTALAEAASARAELEGLQQRLAQVDTPAQQVGQPVGDAKEGAEG